MELSKTKLLIVGCGGLAATLIPQLVISGVGHVTILDGDKVESSNLQRQIIFSMADIGLYKVNCMSEFCKALNPDLSITTYKIYLNENLDMNFSQYDVIIDTTDDLWVRYYLNDQCVAFNIPFAVASVQEFKGHVGLFYGKRGPCYRCIFPHPPDLTLLPTCEQGGIFTPVPGLFGLLQAKTILKYLLNSKKIQQTQWLEMNCLTLDTVVLNIEADPKCLGCQLN